MAEEKRPTVLIWMVILAAPLALGLETLLRAFLFPPDFEVLRGFLEPVLTPAAYATCGLVALASFVGWLLQKRWVDKRLARFEGKPPPDQLRFVHTSVFLLTSSIPQIPTVIATFMYMFGSSPIPVLISVAICSVGVLAQARRV